MRRTIPLGLLSRVVALVAAAALALLAAPDAARAQTAVTFDAEEGYFEMVTGGSWHVVGDPGDHHRCISDQTGWQLVAWNATIVLHAICFEVIDNAEGHMEVHVHTSVGTTPADYERFWNNVPDIEVDEYSQTAGRWVHVLNDSSPDDPYDFGDSTIIGVTTLGTATVDTLGYDTRVSTTAVEMDCAEALDRSGAACSTNAITTPVEDVTNMRARISILNGEAVEEPDPPTNIVVVRSEDFTEATVTWRHYRPAIAYQVERIRAIGVAAGVSQRVEYGDNRVEDVPAMGIAGVSSYDDTGLEADSTYAYRVRARGFESDDWGAWSPYTFVGEERSAVIDAPPNVRLSRDADSVTISWTAPQGAHDGYTVQRQQFTEAQGSTVFADVVSFPTSGWLPDGTLSYTDAAIFPSRTYEYRVAAVNGDAVGQYSTWARSAPVNTELGSAPLNVRLLPEMDEWHDTRREYWIGWEAVPGADSYEVEVEESPLTGIGVVRETFVVTDRAYYVTAYGTVAVRVRGRLTSATLCGEAEDDTCHGAWSGWVRTRFTPEYDALAAPAPVGAGADVMAFRDDLNDGLDAALSPIGTDVDTELAVQFGVLAASLGLAAASVIVAWRRGMAPLGVGMGCAVVVTGWFVAWRLFGVPIAWPIAGQTLLIVAGLYAAVRQLSVFR